MTVYFVLMLSGAKRRINVRAPGELIAADHVGSGVRTREGGLHRLHGQVLARFRFRGV